MKNLSQPIRLGMVFGFLFFLHALIPYSQAWPMIWPIIAGVLIVLKTGNRNFKNYLEAFKNLLKGGSVAAALFFVFTLLFLAFNLQSFYADSIMITTGKIVGLLIAAGLGLIFTLISGSLVYPFLKK